MWGLLKSPKTKILVNGLTEITFLMLDETTSKTVPKKMDNNQERKQNYDTEFRIIIIVFKRSVMCK